MTDHYEEFRPEEIEERLEQLLQLDDVAFPSSNLEHDVRLAKYLELVFHESGNADKASIESVKHKLFQQLPKYNSQPEYGKITSLPTNNARYIKRDQSTMQKNSYSRGRRLVEVLVAVCLLGIVGAGLLLFLNIYQGMHPVASPLPTPTTVPATPKATSPAVHATPTSTQQARTCTDSTATQQASAGTYIRKYDHIFKLDSHSGQIDWTFILPDVVKNNFNIDPLVVGNIVYVSSYSGSVFALDADKGMVLWSQQYPVYEYAPPQSGPGGGSFGDYSTVRSLQVECGLLAFIGSDENVHVLDGISGAEVWHTDNARATAGPVQALVGEQGTLYYSSSIDAKVHAYNILNGHELWSHPLVANNVFTHIDTTMLYNTTQVLSTSDGHLLFDSTQIQQRMYIQRVDQSIAYFMTNGITPFVAGAYDINAQRLLWQNNRDLGNTMLESHGRVYIINSNNAFFVLDAKTGQVLWENNLSWLFSSDLPWQARDIGNVIYVRDVYNIYGLSLDGRILWSYSYPLMGHYSPGVFSYNISYGDQWFYRFADDAAGFHLTAINPQVGQVAWKQDLPDSTYHGPAYSDRGYGGPSPQAPFGPDSFGIITID
ncbi:outer membrane protein assembly factor BamB family protein [Dictyobacter kobayashii]|uniref:Pyrrolo-quinoline quinone repeat domain-containing protein n=1 Tax=Dictyobacter kobayashii TaxID=2014872 RepID=A0A402AIU0_9CHLR|nr:PQQ-binding-like beta-propeller repeat protein [Dictyobacter kobayashii]GCE18999.1 hypothetical protein KDK_27990 [Dictyobacter kobayashii]